MDISVVSRYCWRWQCLWFCRVQENNARGKAREEGEAPHGMGARWLEGKISLQDQMYNPTSFHNPKCSASAAEYCWKCRLRSNTGSVALTSLTFVLFATGQEQVEDCTHVLATSNPIARNNTTIPALQQLFSDAWKVAPGYKAFHGPLLQKQTNQPQTKPQWWLHLFCTSSSSTKTHRGQLPGGPYLEVHCQHWACRVTSTLTSHLKSLTKAASPWPASDPLHLYSNILYISNF